MKIGKNTDRYILGLLQGGPAGALKAGVDLRDKRKSHQRKKELKATPRTQNINTSPGVTHVSYSTNHGNSKNSENGDVNDNNWNYG